MWGLSPTDNNSQINAYKAQYGITNPCAGTEGGGPQAITVTTTGQPFIGYPTYVVVCPDHTVHFDVCWPPAVNCFDPYFEGCGASGLVAAFETNTEQICQGGSVAFTDMSACGIESWEWTFEGGTPETSTEQNPVVTYENSGEFTVELTVSNGTSFATTTSSELIIVNALPDVTLEAFGEVCLEWEPFELTGGMPEGGEYSGPGVSDGLFDPQAVGLGTYTLAYTYVDEFDCENFAEAEITVTSCVGMDELIGSALRVYPNPSKGIFNVKSDTDEPMEMEIFNSVGQKIMNSVIAGSGQIDLSGQPEGIYFLKIKSQNQNKMIRIVLMN